jgi:hypothetical protein
MHDHAALVFGESITIERFTVFPEKCLRMRKVSKCQNKGSCKYPRDNAKFDGPGNAVDSKAEEKAKGSSRMSQKHSRNFLEKE